MAVAKVKRDYSISGAENKRALERAQARRREAVAAGCCLCTALARR